MQTINMVERMETTLSTPMKVYCDASYNHDNGHGYAGWMVCNHNGQPIDIAGQDIGKQVGSNRAEVEAMQRAIDVFRDDDDVQHLVLYSDCTGAINKIIDRNYQKGFESVRVVNALRDDTQIPDALARMAGGFGSRQKKNPDRPSEQTYGTTD